MMIMVIMMMIMMMMMMIIIIIRFVFGTTILSHFLHMFIHVCYIRSFTNFIAQCAQSHN